MSKIVFENDKSNIYDASIYNIGSNQVRIVFDRNLVETIPDDSIIYSGFVLVNEYNHTVEADFRDFIYKYRDVEESWVFDLDNNNIPYVPEPEPTPPEPPIPPTPTLAQVIANKISELSEYCHNEIEYGIDLRINNNIEHFSYSLSGGDQNNIDDLFNTMNLTLSSQYYHADGGSCKLYTPAQIFYIYFGNKAETQDAVTYYNQLVMYIEETYEDAEDTEENRNAVSAIRWRETKLTGKYLELYEAVLAQGQTQLVSYRESLEARGVDFSEDIYPVDKEPEEVEESEE